MTNQVKTQITEAALSYMAGKEMTAANLSKLSGVNQSYLSAMLNGKLTVPVGEKETDIADKWWLLLADAVGVSLEKKYWKPVATKQMRHIMTSLETARDNGRATTIICDTGMGKSFCVDRFQNEFPKDVFVITINSLVRLHDVVNMLLDRLNLPQKSSKAMRMITIIMKLREMKRAGMKPTIVFDEAENMEHALVKMMKGLFDGLSGYASLIQMGTPQLLAKMYRAKNSNMEGGPQYFRRFKVGIQKVSPVVDFDPFFKELGIEPKLQKLLIRECDNYGELRDYLEPALRETDVRGVPLTADEFRVIHNIAA